MRLFMEITSLTNAKVKTWMKYHQKKYRDKDQCFLVEGEHLIQEAIEADALKVLLLKKESKNIFAWQGECYYVSEEIMKKLSMNVSQISCIGVCHKKSDVFSNDANRILLLDDVQDPGNLGTLVRSAYSFGFDAIFASKNSVDLYNDKVIRSTQGALFHIPYFQMEMKDAISLLKKNDFSIYATALKNAKPLSSFSTTDEKIAIVLGNEGNGVHSSIIDECDTSIKIEMKRFESLNVAVAGGICMYYFRK